MLTKLNVLITRNVQVETTKKTQVINSIQSPDTSTS